MFDPVTHCSVILIKNKNIIKVFKCAEEDVSFGGKVETSAGRKALLQPAGSRKIIFLILQTLFVM